MESMTKNRQDKAVLERMAEKVFAPVEMRGYQELTEGYYNVAYALTLRRTPSYFEGCTPPGCQNGL